jgi:hypothetical protein
MDATASDKDPAKFDVVLLTGGWVGFKLKTIMESSIHNPLTLNYLIEIAPANIDAQGTWKIEPAGVATIDSTDPTKIIITQTAG